MKRYDVLTGVLLVLFLATLGGAFYLWELVTGGADKQTMWVIYEQALMVPKIVMNLCLFAAVFLIAVLVAGLVTPPKNGANKARMMLIGGLAMSAWGLYGGLYSAWIMTQAVEAVGRPPSFLVLAPGVAEILLTLALGFFDGVLGAVGASLLLRRAERRKAA